MVKVTITFLYDELKGRSDQYYKDLAWDEIYESDDNLSTDCFVVTDYKKNNYELSCCFNHKIRKT